MIGDNKLPPGLVEVKLEVTVQVGLETCVGCGVRAPRQPTSIHHETDGHWSTSNYLHPLGWSRFGFDDYCLLCGIAIKKAIAEAIGLRRKEEQLP